jgi:uncharacterized protein (TIGR00661 family)
MSIDYSAPKTILITPLNWGLGHATRCIPIIRALLENNFIPIIASDGAALALLRKEFPYIQSLELPSYQIEYAKNGRNFKWQLIKSLPKMIAAIVKEKKIVNLWIKKYEIDGIISDNRPGVFSKKVPTVYITHQLNVMTGNTTKFSSKCHQYFIKKHKECWIPDTDGDPNLTGELGHLTSSNLNLKYIGPLSRMHKKEIPKQYDLMIILSGPEPQRTMLEEKLQMEIERFEGEIIFVKGIVEKTQTKQKIKNVTYYNFMNTKQLEQTFNESELVLCRSGYTSIMDLAKLGKKAFFIPTPGQYEQEYLAVKLQDEQLVPYATQNDFTIEDLSKVKSFKGLSLFENEIDWDSLFSVFKK